MSDVPSTLEASLPVKSGRILIRRTSCSSGTRLISGTGWERMWCRYLARRTDNTHGRCRLGTDVVPVPGQENRQHTRSVPAGNGCGAGTWPGEQTTHTVGAGWERMWCRYLARPTDNTRGYGHLRSSLAWYKLTIGFKRNTVMV